MPKFIFSTLTNDQVYSTWKQSDGTRLPTRDAQVLVKGGTGVASKHFVTPRGVMTEVTDEQLAILKKVPAFQRHVDRKFLAIEDKAYEPEKVAADLDMADPSAPLTDADYEPGHAPQVGNVTEPETESTPSSKRRRT